jgi:hypothetical protein
VVIELSSKDVSDVALGAEDVPATLASKVLFAIFANEMVPEPVIVPPVKPEPVATEVT